MNQLPNIKSDSDEITIGKVNELIRQWTNQVEYHRLTKSSHPITRKEVFKSLNEQLSILEI